ncbi:Uncharacterised protein [Streptococcus pneumoniae]|nr:Uncharacterised protein [Streptococcus pneumoniae]
MFFKDEKQALYTKPKTKSSSFRASKVSNQTIVATTRTDCQVIALNLCDKLENGVVVVVQTTHHIGIDDVIYSKIFQHLTHSIKMSLTFFIKKVKDRRRILYCHLVFFFLRVQDTKRIFLQATLAILRQGLLERCQIVNQGLAVGCTALRISKSVEVQFDTLNTDFLQKMGCHSDCFHIGSWIARAKTLNTNLVELAQAPCLWTLITEHRSHIVELAWLLHFWGEEFIFHIGTDNGRSSFWTEGNMTVTLVIKIVHFLGYDIRCISDRATDNLVMLENRRTHFCVVVAFENFTGKALNVLPLSRLSR